MLPSVIGRGNTLLFFVSWDEMVFLGYKNDKNPFATRHVPLGENGG